MGITNHFSTLVGGQAEKLCLPTTPDHASESVYVATTSTHKVSCDIIVWPMGM